MYSHRRAVMDREEQQVSSGEVQRGQRHKTFLHLKLGTKWTKMPRSTPEMTASMGGRLGDPGSPGIVAASQP